MNGTQATMPLGDNVEVDIYDVESIRSRYDNWDELSSREKLGHLKQEQPVSSFSERNNMTAPYRQHVAELAFPDDDDATIPWEVNRIAFGDDDSDKSIDDEHLGNEVYRTDIDDLVRDGTTIRAITLLGSDDAAGLTLYEAALVTGDEAGSEDNAFNRVLLDDDEGRLDPKGQEHAVTVRVELLYQDESEVTE